MANLGERMRSSAEAQRLRDDEQSGVRAMSQASSRRRRVGEFIKDAKASAAEAADAGNILASVEIPDEFWGGGDDRSSLSCPEHPDHDLLLAFKEWAAGEGLDVAIDLIYEDVPRLHMFPSGMSQADAAHLDRRRSAGLR